MKILDDKILRQVIKKRPQNSHKGDYGRLLVVAGNKQYGGAAILSTSAAVYSGTGLVSLTTDPINFDALHARLPEAMLIDWAEPINQATYDLILVGPGLGFEPAQVTLFEKILAHQLPGQWLVIDGSAITIFAQKNLDLKYPEYVLFTPHQMELERLSGIKIAEQNEENIATFAQKLGASIVAKSSQTSIFSGKEDQEPVTLTIGSPAQATGGMGDTLAGMIAGFLAQFKKDYFNSISAASYLHSRIAHDLAKENYVVLPSQIIELIPKYMKEFEE